MNPAGGGSSTGAVARLIMFPAQDLFAFHLFPLTFLSHRKAVP